jgi:tetratricopeptide (TPR) repeat protein
MITTRSRHVPRRVWLAFAAACCVAPLGALSGAQAPVSPEDRKRRSIAESQHEIVMLHIDRKEYTKAVEEAGKIFQMNWPADKEPTLLKSILIYADRLISQKQEPLALQLLEANFKTFRTNESKIAILKEQGFLHRQLNQSTKALDCFREAQRLEKQSTERPD